MGGEGSEAALAGARNVPATCLALNKFSLLVATHLLTGRIRLRAIWFVGRTPPIW